MPVSNVKILMLGTAPAGQPVTITDQATAAVLASAMADSTTAQALLQQLLNAITAGDGTFAMLLPYAEFLQAAAAGQASGTGVEVPGAQSGGAGGSGGASAGLAQAQHLTGEADGKGGGVATPSTPLAGTATGTGGGSGAPSIAVPGSMSGGAGGTGGASGAPVANPGLTGAAGGKGTAGPSVLAQQEPIAAAGGGQGGASGTVTVGAGKQSSTDNFNRANGALGSPWATPSGVTAPTIVSNVCSGASGNAAYQSMATGDHYAEVASVSGDGGGPAVRVQAGSKALYRARLVYDGIADNGSYSLEVDQLSATGALTWLRNPANFSDGIAGGATLRLEIVGSAITAKVNGTTKWTGTDTAVTGGAPGVSFGASGTVDNWAGGDL